MSPLRLSIGEAHFVVEPAELLPACDDEFSELLRAHRDAIDFDIANWLSA